MKFKKSLSLMMAGALCVSLFGCSKPAEPAPSETPDTPAPSESAEPKNLVLCESWNFESGFYPVLTAANSANYGATYWLKNFYDNLITMKDGEYIGSLAESWTISEDGKTYTFKIRDGVKFSDGTPLTASAVRTSIEAAVVNLGQFNGSYGKLTTLIESTEAPDDSTFILHLVTPYYGTLNDLAMANPLAIVNPAILNEDLTVNTEAASRQTMGTGPYMYDGQFDGQTYTFVRNPEYWGEAPELDTFQVKVIEDNDAKVLALRSGEIDAILGASHIGADAYVELAADPAFGAAVSSDPSQTRYLGLNFSNPIFRDEAVRKAMSYAIDNDTLASTVFQGTEIPAESLFVSDKPYCNVDVTRYEYAPEKSAALLDEAGWVDSDGDGIRDKDGSKLEFELLYTSAYGSIGDGMLAVAENLNSVGFKVTPVDKDMMTFYGATLNGDYDMTEYQSYGGIFDPMVLMTNINPSVSMDPVASQWSSFLENGAELIAELDSTANTDRVQEIYDLVLSSIADQALFIPLTHSAELGVWDAEKMESYGFCFDSQYIDIAAVDMK